MPLAKCAIIASKGWKGSKAAGVSFVRSAGLAREPASPVLGGSQGRRPLSASENRPVR